MECKYIICSNCREEYACYSHNEITFCEKCEVKRYCKRVPLTNKSAIIVGSFCNSCLGKTIEQLEEEDGLRS